MKCCIFLYKTFVREYSIWFVGDGGAVLVNGNTYLPAYGGSNGYTNQNGGSNGYANQNGASNGYTNQNGGSNNYTNQNGGSNGYTNQNGISNGYINPDVIPIQSQLSARPPSLEESVEKGGFLGVYFFLNILMKDDSVLLNQLSSGLNLKVF